jgi:hypothetical protein
MTANDHNKVVGIMHLVYAGFSVLMMIGMCLVFLLMIMGTLNSHDGPPTAFFIAMMVVMFVMYVVFSLPSFLAGYTLLKRKPSAKVLGIIAAIIAGMSSPFGTALCVYTLWFLFGEPGRALYDKSISALPPAPPVWANFSDASHEREYVPRTPPDWR